MLHVAGTDECSLAFLSWQLYADRDKYVVYPCTDAMDADRASLLLFHPLSGILSEMSALVFIVLFVAVHFLRGGQIEEEAAASGLSVASVERFPLSC